jgi:hypothetical protein
MSRTGNSTHQPRKSKQEAIHNIHSTRGKWRVSAPDARLRVTPAQYARVLEHLAAGAELLQLSEADAWIFVKVEHKGRKINGWLLKTEAAPVAAETPVADEAPETLPAPPPPSSI